MRGGAGRQLRPRGREARPRWRRPAVVRAACQARPVRSRPWSSGGSGRLRAAHPREHLCTRRPRWARSDVPGPPSAPPGPPAHHGPGNGGRSPVARQPRAPRGPGTGRGAETLHPRCRRGAGTGAGMRGECWGQVQGQVLGSEGRWRSRRPSIGSEWRSASAG